MTSLSRLLIELTWFTNHKTDTEAAAAAHRGACKILAENSRRAAKDEQFLSLLHQNSLCYYRAPIPIPLSISIPIA